MSKRATTLTATYRLSGDEYLQVQLTIANDYPDALREASATVTRTMHDQLADVLAQTRT